MQIVFTAASSIPAYGRFCAFISARARARADSLSRDKQGYSTYARVYGFVEGFEAC